MEYGYHRAAQCRQALNDFVVGQSYSPSFFLRWPSVRNRSALSLMKPAASR
ncbi:argininosuccinate synthase [Nitrobacter sp. Nb-311A]|nr:argininosuccinate synthase [Nitrobacter sp. Nb-311A]